MRSTVYRWIRRAWRRWRRPAFFLLTGLVGATGLVALLGLLLGPVAWKMGGGIVAGLHGKDQADAINAVRQTLLAAAGGVVIVAGLGFTGGTYLLSRRGHQTDRYGKAIAQLASQRRDERLGGIYALQHLMRESPREQDSIVQVLAAFAREPAREIVPSSESEPAPVGADIAAAVAVLGRRPRRPESTVLDLTGTNLRGITLNRVSLHLAMLQQVQLDDALLVECDLSESLLAGASMTRILAPDGDLRGANLTGANLIEARLENCDLRKTNFSHADLSQSSLRKADLRGAVLDFANLEGAIVELAQLEKVASLNGIRGLSQEQLLALQGKIHGV